jgi:predicted alpha/beta-hydrolase family hydrolase
MELALEDGGQTTATLYPSDTTARALLALAHGAGAGQGHPFMVHVARGLAGRGVDVVTFDFPYMHQKRKMPDRAPVLEACFRTVLSTVRDSGALEGRRLFIGGKSMGGRMATHLAAQGVDNLAGTVAFGYPLHPPGKPEQVRTAHLPSISTPLLIVQGERDTFGTPDELQPVIATMRAPTKLFVVKGGDHSLGVRSRGRGEVLAEVLDVVAAWMLSPRVH